MHKVGKWTKLKRIIIYALTHDHRFLSVLYRRHYHYFSRDRRVTILFQVVMTSLACNAIFYELNKDDATFSPQKILTAFFSAIICFPINTISLMLFKRACPWHSPKSDPTEGMSVGRLDGSDILITVSQKMQKSFPENRLKRGGGKLLIILKGPYPPYVIIAAYIISLGILGLSTLLILLKTAQFSRDLMFSWIMSSLLSIAQDIFLNQPITSILSALVYLALGLEIGFNRCPIYCTRCYPPIPTQIAGKPNL